MTTSELNCDSITNAKIKLGLGLWDGKFRRIDPSWLRWCDAQGNWQPTEAEAERQEKEKLANYLRSIGIDPDNLPPI